MADVSKLKRNAIAYATYDSLLQFALRFISFFLNALIVRHVSQAVFAVISVKLHLLYATGLLLSQEAFRRAALSADLNKKKLNQLINLIWLGTALSLPLALAESLVWLYFGDRPPDDVTSHYDIGVILVAFSVVIEVAAEAPFILAELNLWTKTKVFIEGSMQVFRSFLIAIGVICWPNYAVLVYAISHIMGSLIYFSLYYGIFAKYLSSSQKNTSTKLQHFNQLFPTYGLSKNEDIFDSELLAVSCSFFKQGWLKWLLTEGELYLMTFFPVISLSQQGVYQVVNNLGSLAARLIFRSIEAAAYKFFAQILKRGQPITHQSKVHCEEAAMALELLLGNLMIFSLVIIGFGWSYSHLLLQLYGGSALSESGSVLMKAQCFYIVFLSINGVTESFTFAVMDDKQLAKHNFVLVAFSVAYLIAAVMLTQYFGAIGFILANCFNMSLRIANSLGFIQELFSQTTLNPLKSLLISPSSLLWIIASFLVTALSEILIYPWSILLHLCIGGCSFIILVYFLRHELRGPIEKLLSLLERMASLKSLTLIHHIRSFLYPLDKLKKQD